MAVPEHDRGERVPSVVASQVGITYRIYGSGRTLEGDESSVLRRLFRQGTRNVGVREVEAVKDVSFVAYRGESIGLVGRNGSGKSTLLRSIAGVVPPTEGRIWLGGHASLLGVNAALMPKLSGRRNVWIGAQALGLSRREVREKFDEIVEFADIGEFIDLPMQSYSSGMGARLRFAISTAVVPDILVVDEALATGDAQFRDRAQERIARIREHAGTVFMVSHGAETIKKSCDRALWIDGGRLVMDGPAEEVVDAYSDAHGRKRRVPSGRKTASGAGRQREPAPAAKPLSDTVYFDVLTLPLDRPGAGGNLTDASLVSPSRRDLEALAETFGREMHEHKLGILLDRLANPDEECWVIRDRDGEDVGYCSVAWGDRFQESLNDWVRLEPHQFLVFDTQVLRRYRSSGLEEFSFQARCAIGRQRGRTEAVMVVRSNSRALLGLYRSLGAEYAGRYVYSRSRRRSELLPEPVAELLRGPAEDPSPGG